jgi:AcrR family transcriptional regulator
MVRRAAGAPVPRQPPPPRAEDAGRTGKQLQQERARVTRQALLEAAARVFAAKGFDDAQTPDIAEAAGVSVGTFYRYFEDKRQVFVDVIRGHLADMHHSVMSRLTPDRFAGADHRRSIDVVLEVLFEQVRRAPALERLFIEMSLRDAETARLREEFERLGHDALAALIAQIVPRRVAPDPAAAAHVVRLAAQEVALTQGGLRGLRPVSDQAARTALREMLHRYLFPGSAATSTGSSTTKAVRSTPPSTKTRPPWASTARRQK